MKNRNKRLNQILTKKFLTREYIINEKSTPKIAKEIKCNIKTILLRLKQFKIQIRTNQESHKLINMRGKNSATYVDGRTLKQYYCKDCNKPICLQTALYGSEQCRSCVNSGKNNNMFGIHRLGNKSPNYIDGRTSFHHIIRDLKKYKDWRFRIFKRDNYTCQECGIKLSGILNAHHLKEFHELLAEFLQEYNQFSPIEDKETLVRLAMKWKPFWDIDNGKTLCEDCHKLKHAKENNHD